MGDYMYCQKRQKWEKNPLLFLNNLNDYMKADDQLRQVQTMYITGIMTAIVENGIFPNKDRREVRARNKQAKHAEMMNCTVCVQKYGPGPEFSKIRESKFWFKSNS